MAYTSQDFPTLTQKLNEAFNEAASVSMAEWKGKDVFDVIDTDWQVYNFLHVNGAAGGFSRLAEGQQLPVVNSQEGDSANWTQKRYGSRVAITKDLRKFERYDLMESIVHDEVDFAFNRIDQTMADILLNGFTGTSFTDVFGDTQSNLSVDGVVLFSASHTYNGTSSTYTNLIRNAAGTTNPALDRDPVVKARTDAMLYKDASGINRPINLDTLIVGATNSDLAERMIYSSGVINTPNVDINPLKSAIKRIITWPRLDLRGDATDTSAYWFMADSKHVKKSLKAPFAQKPMMASPKEVDDTLDWMYPVDAYYTLGIGWAAYVRGSTGAN